MAWTVGVDVGGTFTDFYALNDETGETFVGKTPSTPANPALAVISGLRDLCGQHDIDLLAVNRLAHGTTVGTNALIQRRGGTVAMVTTEGFRDLLEIGRQTRPHMYDLVADQPEALVPRERRFEFPERFRADGTAERVPSEADVAAVIETLRHSGVDAVAIGFIFAFRYPDHERRLAAAIEAAGLDLHVSLSSEVQPEFREYERFSTTVLNAYLQPVMAEYVRTLETELSASIPNAALGINQSSGGLMSPARARTLPVRTALSGPAAGAVGAEHVARLAGRADVVTLDIGGTSADVALIRDFQASISFDREVAGFPIRLPAVDIETVGAGGGSIGWFDRDGLLKVGPTSAGADPGPACYGRGGSDPTVTDANLVLGRLSTGGLLGGTMALDVDLARQAIAPIADQLGYSVERTAQGMLDIMVANMVRAIRTISVERGYDPRGFTLMPFGGAGPLHARAVAQSLGMSELLIPPAPGIVCAEGLIVSDLKEDFVVSRRVEVHADNAATLTSPVQQLIADANAWFEREGVAPTSRRMEISFDARYVGQNFELSVPCSEDDVAGIEPEVLRQRFFAVHEHAYGYFNGDAPVEIINYRLTARGQLHTALTPNENPAVAAPPTPIGQRPVFFSDSSSVLSDVYARSDLLPGHSLVGPAIVEQLDTTSLIYPGDRATVLPSGALLIALTDSARETKT